MKQIIFCILMVNLSFALDDTATWNAVGNGVKFQEADLGTGTIRVELHHDDDKNSDFVMQRIIFIPADPDNVMIQDIGRQKVLFTLYTLKNGESPYSYSIENGIDGYTISIDNVKQDRSSKINGIRFSAPLLQSSELRLGMNGHIMQIIKGRD